MPSYKIVRFYANKPGRYQVEPNFHDEGGETAGLSLEDAQDHCNDPETSSKTCESEAACFHTQVYGTWLDGYSEE